MRKQDILGRENFINTLMQFLECLAINRGNSIFAIDGKWGTGKSYVLDMFEEQLKATELGQACGNKYLVFHYNCWKYDYYDEPAVAIVASMYDAIKDERVIISENTSSQMQDIMNKVKETIENIAGDFIKNKIGIDLVQIVRDVYQENQEQGKEEREFDSLFSFQKTLSDMRVKLQELSAEKTIVLVVDELDRCMPAYAIKIMERIHHIFEGIANICVILAIDSPQLEQSIKQIFGQNISVEKYLNKFIDFTFKLDVGRLSGKFSNTYADYYNEFINDSEYDVKHLEELYENIFSGWDIRKQEKMINRAKLLHINICGTEKCDIFLLGFELLWIVLLHCKLATRLNDLFDVIDSDSIPQGININDKRVSYFVNMIKDAYKRRKSNAIDNSYAQLGDYFIEKIIWLISKATSGNCPFRYADETAMLTEIECAEKFRRIASGMKWD